MATTPTLDKSTMDIENDQVKTVRVTYDVLIPGGVDANKRIVYLWAAFRWMDLKVEYYAQDLKRKVGNGAETPVTVAPWEVVNGNSQRLLKGSVTVGDATQPATLKGWVEFTVENPAWLQNLQGDYQVSFHADVTEPTVV